MFLTNVETQTLLEKADLLAEYTLTKMYQLGSTGRIKETNKNMIFHICR